MRILLVEDARKLAAFITRGLKAEGYTVDCAYDGQTAQERALTGVYDLVILDLMLPKKDGVTVCRILRERGVNVPILMLTAKGELEDRVRGLDAGADDYLVKPFDFEELTARIRTLLRRPQQSLPDVAWLRDISIDCSRRKVWRRGIEIPLSQKEFALLEFLIRHRNKVVSRDEIMNHCWGKNAALHTNVIDVYIKKLRQKLEPGHEQGLIQTVRGAGYMIED